jgi:cysteine-rich repeat protein
MTSITKLGRNGLTLSWIAAGALIAVLHPTDLPAHCGNGIRESPEQCDGSDFGGATCSSAFGVSCGRMYCFLEGGTTPTCTYSPQSCGGICGDGCARAPEECDDGDRNSDPDPDACRTNCVNHHCGDNTTDSDEECDNGPANDDDMPDACRTTCVRAYCGDGTRDGSEACDLGAENGTTGSTCSATCALAGCGTGTLDPGETCDDDNLDNDDGCLATCVPNVCGDGFTNLDVDPVSLLIQEVCDPTRFEPLASCRYDCGQRFAMCGDGDVDPGEECDSGAANSEEPNAACRTDCQLPRCGDGVVDDAAAVPEECDRGPDCGSDCRLRS